MAMWLVAYLRTINEWFGYWIIKEAKNESQNNYIDFAVYIFVSNRFG